MNELCKSVACHFSARQWTVCTKEAPEGNKWRSYQGPHQTSIPVLMGSTTELCVIGKPTLGHQPLRRE